MIYVDLDKFPPAKEWLDAADALTKSLIAAKDANERKEIIDKNKDVWGQLKAHLSTIRNRKCWYSESVNDAAHCHVDHFRPKTNALDDNGNDHGGYWWLAFDWMNYRYAGPAPNVRKKDYFPVSQNKATNYGDNIALEDILLLDPINIGDPGKLAFDVEGRVLPKATDKTSRDYKKAFYSIERYNLNMEGLKEGRRQKQLKVTQLITQSQKLVALQAVKHDAAREHEIIQLWKELRDLAHPNSEYSAAVKYCLRSSGYDWATEIAMAA